MSSEYETESRPLFRVRRRSTLAAVAGSILLGGLAFFLRIAGRQDPANVLLVTLDTVRADHLGLYGYGRPTSPNLDALAADGVRFDFAISTSAATPVAHASILTGRNPPNHGLRVIYAGSGYRLPDGVPTLAEILSDRGWATAGVVSSFTASGFFGLDRGFESFDSPLGDDVGFREDKPSGMFRWDLRKNQRRADRTTDRALEWLASVEPKTPWFLWVHYWDPHDPVLRPPDDWSVKFRSPGMKRRDRRIAVYDEEIAYLDFHFGRLLDHLRATRELDRTLVVVIGDHGEGLGNHDWWGHRILYQEQIRVPLIWRDPSGPRKTSVPDLVRSIDVVPTLLDRLGIRPAPGLDGASWREMLSGDAKPRSAYADAINRYDLNALMVKWRPDDDLLHSLVEREWKLIYRPLEPEKSELYHLPSDPSEARNRFASEPDVARRMMAALDAHEGYVEGPLGPAADPEALERLRSLGYVE